jgi:hypothetical protein
MRIELKNLKVADHLSERTLAFSASVYVDGKRVGEALNDGRGGNNRIDVLEREWDRGLTQAMEAEAKRHTWSYEGETYTHNLDSYIGELVISLL